MTSYYQKTINQSEHATAHTQAIGRILNLVLQDAAQQNRGALRLDTVTLLDNDAQ